MLLCLKIFINLIFLACLCKYYEDLDLFSRVINRGASLSIKVCIPASTRVVWKLQPKAFHL